MKRQADMVTKSYTPREAERILTDDGWYVVRTRGSHKQFKHPTKPGLVTLPVHPGKNLGINVVKSIERQSGIKF
ncbi:type II toxin-antitoxin system HicA family toxin [Pelotomaculum propionicicum]|uniref:Addiction module toxin, HicA family n=1 Tax=Pelotomaculum propionicicum TaxID=258475 RepID=A0A4Y7RPS3_9FIRM|nr:type II toxin-antitoxin system HicA family toxin [Pelotomaculum propionicicum]TEB10851.1 hypothetical protein Pmgp_02017 [Pelotomaculum propionicicum]